MVRLWSTLIGTAVAGLLIAPSGAIAAPSGVAGPWLVAGSATSAGSLAPAPLKARKPRATLSLDSVLLSSGKVRLTVTSNAKSVKVSHRTAKGTVRTVVRRTKRGAARITLPAGSRSIRVRARATSRLAASAWLRVETPAATPDPVPNASSGSPPNGPAQSAPPTARVTPPAPDPVATAFEAEVGRLVNEARAVARVCGTTTYPAVPALAMNDLLVHSARAHSQDMAANGYFSHTGLDGSQPWDRMTSVGYSWSAAGENIAAGQSTAQQVMNVWLTSSGHCANIMSGSFTEMGVGHAFSASAPYGHYWTQNFGRSAHE